MRTPQELFQASPVFKDYEAILNNPAFDYACSTALAAFMEGLSRNPTDPSKSWDCYLQYLGAKAVLDQLSQLNLKPEQPKPAPYQWHRPKTTNT